MKSNRLILNRIRHVLRLMVDPFYAWRWLCRICTYVRMKYEYARARDISLLKFLATPVHADVGHIEVDQQKCVGCTLCSMACSYLRHGSFNPKRAAIQIYKSEFDALDLPFVCFQCEDPACVKVCPTGAMQISGGIAVIDELGCISCKLCTKACRWKNIPIDPVSGFPIKCDLCKGRASEPECVKWCEPQAITVSTKKD